MEVGSSGRGASAEDDPTVGAVSGGVGGGGGGGGDGDDTRRRRDIQAVMIAAARDRAIRTESVRHDLALNLPPRLELPDGEEHPYGAHPDLHLRNPEQVKKKREELERDSRNSNKITSSSGLMDSVNAQGFELRPNKGYILESILHTKIYNIRNV